MAKPSWVTLSKSTGSGGGSVSVTASANPYSSARSGSLTVKTASGLTKTVSVSQKSDKYYIFFRGNLFFQNQIKEQVELPAIDIYVHLQNSEGDSSDLFQVGTMHNLAYNTTDMAEIELDQIFDIHPDQAPFDRLDYIQLQINSNKNLDGYTGGEITCSSDKDNGYVREDVEFYIGKLELSTPLLIDYMGQGNCDINNTIDTPIVITNFY